MKIKELEYAEFNEYYDIMEYLAKTYFGNRCAVTHKPFERKGFTIHHLEEEEFDVLSRNYKHIKRPSTRAVTYIRALKQQFETDPTLKDRTVLIRNYIHFRLDHYKNGVCKFPMEQRQRFCDIAMRTRTQGRKRKV